MTKGPRRLYRASAATRMRHRKNPKKLVTVEAFVKNGDLQSRRVMDVGYLNERTDLQLLICEFPHIITGNGESPE